MQYYFFFCCFVMSAVQGLKQWGAMNTNGKPNANNQIDAEMFIRPKPDKNMLRRIYNTREPKFIIEDQKSPKLPDNVKYTETKDLAIYIIELPRFSYMTYTEDVVVEMHESYISVLVKGSGLHTNDEFLPVFSPDTLPSIAHTRDYTANIYLFQNVRNASNCSKITIKEIELKDGVEKTYEIRVEIKKSELVVPKYFMYPEKYNPTFINNYQNEDNKNTDFHEKVPFEKKEFFSNKTNEKVEVFRKKEEDKKENVWKMEKAEGEPPKGQGSKEEGFGDALKSAIDSVKKDLDEDIVKKLEKLQ